MEILRTIDEWEVEVGTQLRSARMLAGVSQTDLAKRANVAVGAISGLEAGRGSTLKTLIAVLRALGRTQWLEQLAPVISISPIQMMRDQQRRKPRRRVYAPRVRAADSTMNSTSKEAPNSVSNPVSNSVSNSISNLESGS